jgi:hypothetical protein
LQTDISKTDFKKLRGLLRKLQNQRPRALQLRVRRGGRIRPARTGKLALLWVNDSGAEKRFTFADISALSQQGGDLFASFGIK